MFPGFGDTAPWRRQTEEYGTRIVRSGGKDLGDVRIVPHTEKTQLSPAKIRAIVEALRTRDCAIVDQELEIGLRSISVPVRDAHGRIAAAINISVQANRVSIPDMEASLKPHLLAAAHELGLLLN